MKCNQNRVNLFILSFNILQCDTWVDYLCKTCILIFMFTEEGRSCRRSRRRARYVAFTFYYQNCYPSTQAVMLFFSKQASIWVSKITWRTYLSWNTWNKVTNEYVIMASVCIFYHTMGLLNYMIVCIANSYSQTGSNFNTVTG